MEFWGKEERKNIYIQMGLGSIMSRKLYFGLLSSISNISWKSSNFFTPPSPPLYFIFFLFLSRKLYFGLLSSISNFHGNHLIFSHPPPPLFFLFCKRFGCFNFRNSFFFFFIRDPIREVFVLKKKKKKLSGACARLYYADFILTCNDLDKNIHQEINISLPASITTGD